MGEKILALNFHFLGCVVIPGQGTETGGRGLLLDTDKGLLGKVGTSVG